MMARLLGPSKVSVREGVRRVIEAGGKARVARVHVIGEPKTEVTTIGIGQEDG